MAHQHRHAFTQAEIVTLRQLVSDKMRAVPEKQKGIREAMRRMGFYITDYQSNQAGFTVADFNRLVERGAIAVIEAQAQSIIMQDDGTSAVITRLTVDQPRSADTQAQSLEREAGHAVAVYEDHVPDRPGLYCLRIRQAGGLPPAFASELARRSTDIVYIGLASRSLRARLGQELRARGHGTSFRSIGAALGYVPPSGSLVGAANQRNYKFSPSDTRDIIDWMNEHLLVSWVPCSEGLESIESELIERVVPLFNLSKSPKPFAELKDLRHRCVTIANSPNSAG